MQTDIPVAWALGLDLLKCDCWPQPSHSDAFGPVSKELSDDAAIAAVDLEMTLWDHAV